MSNYTKSTNFATKDNLTPGDPLKIVRGTEIDTEFNNIATAIATKTDNSAAAITGGSITGITDLAIADGGTGASTATAAINNLLPSQTSNANKYLQTDGTNVSWDAVSLSTADITGTLPVANGGTGVTSSTGTGSVVLSNSPTLVTPALGTPSSGTATNLTGLPISTGVSGLGTGVATFLGTPSSANLASAVSDETGSGALVFANSPTLVTPALGTPSSATLTNATGLPISTGVSGLGTGVATFLATPSSANLASAVSDETGSGALVFANSPTLVTPALGTPSSATLTNATGLPISTGVSGLGTGVATALAVNVGSAGAPVVNGGALGTPSSGTVTNLTGTASININGTVGATTPTTGAFTTVAASSSVTLSGGTANGVAYLNGSKVLTTGSALTFDGTDINMQGSAGFTVLGIEPATTIGSSGTNFIHGINSTNIGFKISTVEQMRLTSTGLGIGTSSPTYKLDVNGSNPRIRVNASTGTDYALYQAQNTGGSAFIGLENSAGSALSTGAPYSLNIYHGGAYPILFSTNGTERMRLDSAGNLGLGVTPSAWSAHKVLQVGAWSSFGSYNGNLNAQMMNNAYWDGSAYRYIGSSQASYFSTAQGSFQWNTAASGTAGDAISFTQAMTLDASGNLGIGTTSPTVKLQTSTARSATVVSALFSETGTGAVSDVNKITLSVQNTLGGATGGAGIGAVLEASASNQTGLAFYTDGGSGSQTERARIDSSGNLLVKTVDARIGSDVGSVEYGTSTANSVRFYSSDLERARITSGGDLLVGTTSTAINDLGFRVYGQYGLITCTTNTADYSIFNKTTTTTGKQIEFRSGNTAVGYIESTSTATSYNTSSDYRLKNTIAPMTGALAKVAQLKPVTYKWNADGSDGEGFIAHELAEVCPHAVSGEKDAVDENGNPKYQGIDTSFLVATLTAAIQELKAEFDAYKASHP